MVVDLMIEFAVAGLENEWRVDTMRNHRDMLLAESDWTQYADSPLSDSKKAEWAVYRQALRDFPSTWVPADTCDFPDKPEGA
jgi:hypothetical protein|tara:strand:+ start:324 stop:569 length:246 start_codon:yes stop_codon:yes gene_type:complete